MGFRSSCFGLALAAALLPAPVPAQSAPDPAAEDLPPLCRRGAQGSAVPLSHALTLEAMDYFTTHAARVVVPEADPEDPAAMADLAGDYAFLQAIEWPGVLADRAADLPASAHDLPWLVVLSHLDTTLGDPVWSLTLGPESTLLPHLLPMLDRHGLAEEARVLRMAQGLFPEWDADPRHRLRQVINDSGETVNENLRAALDEATYSWPAGQHRARDAALRLIDGEPALKAAMQARIDELDEAARMDVLMQELWNSCISDWTDDDQARHSLSAMGAAQAALILMDSFSYAAEGTSLYNWFEDASGAHSEALARLFQRRGLTEVAQALRDGIALFPRPFPRQDYLRWEAMAAMTPEQLARFDTLLAEDSFDRVRADMLTLARDSGLLP